MLKVLAMMMLAFGTNVMAGEENLMDGRFSLLEETKGCAEIVEIKYDQEKKCFLYAEGEAAEAITICNLNRGPKTVLRRVTTDEGKQRFESVTTENTKFLTAVQNVKIVNEMNAFGVAIKVVTERTSFLRGEKDLTIDKRYSKLEALKAPVVKATACRYTQL